VSVTFEFLAGEDESLLIHGDALLALDDLLQGLDGAAGLHTQEDGPAREGLYKYLHVLN
jgi:hypothetical protein